jgi:hypothetical protein
MFKYNTMEHKKDFEELNKQALEKLEAYIISKEMSARPHKEKIDAAKEKWQAAWNEFLETLVVLERLEI